MEADEARRRFGEARRAILATTRLDGTVDLVPVTFAVDGDTIFTAVDHKPKTTSALRRLRNVAANPGVTLLAEEYNDADWSALWWVRAKGSAVVISEGEDRDAAAELIGRRYEQYDNNWPAGPAIVATISEWVGWSAS
jgi:PPOX class probable F420-dependent enzyme